MVDQSKVQLWGNFADSSAQNVTLDENVLSNIPESSEASRIHAAGHGASFWTNTACVSLEFPCGQENKYFLKIAAGEGGRGMMEGEFESMKVIHEITPTFGPKPIAWGTFKSDTNIHFFLCDFHEMDDELPEVNRFAENLAKLHQESISPDGKFGFHVTTYNGNIPQDVSWADTWEECFINGTKQDFDLETEARGNCDELNALRVPLFEKVIPRLLRPLETGGRTLKPSFVHGDLWYGNTSNDISADQPIVFDAAGFYGHNEFDVKAMRIVRYQFGRNYMNAYHLHYPISAPEEDLDARLALYSLRSYLHESTLFPSDPKRREELIEETRKLVEMFPNGLEDFPCNNSAPLQSSDVGREPDAPNNVPLDDTQRSLEVGSEPDAPNSAPLDDTRSSLEVGSEHDTPNSAPPLDDKQQSSDIRRKSNASTRAPLDNTLKSSDVEIEPGLLTSAPLDNTRRSSEVGREYDASTRALLDDTRQSLEAGTESPTLNGALLDDTRRSSGAGGEFIVPIRANTII